jgi:hypothetical protein
MHSYFNFFNKAKKVNKAPSVIKSIGVGGSSIFSAEITRKPEPEIAPHIGKCFSHLSYVVFRVDELRRDCKT